MSEPESPESLPEAKPSTAPAGVEETKDEGSEAPPPEPWTPERVSEWNAYYDVYVVLGVMLLAFVTSANVITHSAIWSQLKAGALMIEKTSPLVTDVFSYTETGKRWVNIPWLFEWSHALVHKTAVDLIPADPSDPVATRRKADQLSAGVLVALNALARVATILVLLGVRRSGPGLWWAAFCAMVALGMTFSPVGIILGGIAGPAIVAPITWGQLLLAVEVLILFKAIDQRKPSAAFALVPLFLLWANVDESFLVGLVLLGAAVAGLFAGTKTSEPGRFSPMRGLLLLAACAGVALLNPSFHHIYGAAFTPIRQLFESDSGFVTNDQLSYFGHGIRGAADVERGKQVSQLFISHYFIFVGIGLASFVVNRKNFSLSRFLTFVVMSVMWAFLSLMYSIEFAVVFGATLALNGQEWYQDRFGVNGRLGGGWALWSTGGRFLTILLVFLGIAQGLTGFGKELGETKFGFGFNPDDFSFEAADYLRTAPLRGKILNTSMLQGDSLIWRAYPARQTFIDGRAHLFGPEIRKRLQDARLALKDDAIEKWKPILDEYGITAVMIQESTAPATYRRLMQSSHWIPFYDDGNVVMFGRSDAGAIDLAHFKANRLEPDTLAYHQSKPVPPADPPTAVTKIDEIIQNRFLERSQPHTESSRRWLENLDFDPKAPSLPDPARCILAIREARTALSHKPDDTRAYRLLATAYRELMVQETALLSGLTLTAKDREKVLRTNPRSDALMTRFRQRTTALNFAIQTTPPPKTPSAKVELFHLNDELYRLLISVSYFDLARDRLKALLSLAEASRVTPEDHAEMQRQFKQLDERVRQIQEGMSDMVSQQQAGPLQRAEFALGSGAPGLAIQELEEAIQINDRAAVVKPRLVDLYCDTGQPDKALEIMVAGNPDDPSFGTEPGTSAMRQGRVYFLLGHYEYAATLWEKNAIPRVRFDRTLKALLSGRALVQGEPKAASSLLEVVPSQISTQAIWLNELAMCRLESGQPSLAAEAFTQALKLYPKLPLRLVSVYYLEKLGKPIPPLEPTDADSKTDKDAAEKKEKGEGSKDEKASEKPKPATEEQPKEGKPSDAPAASKPAEPEKAKEPAKDGKPDEAAKPKPEEKSEKPKETGDPAKPKPEEKTEAPKAPDEAAKPKAEEKTEAPKATDEAAKPKPEVKSETPKESDKPSASDPSAKPDADKAAGAEKDKPADPK